MTNTNKILSPFVILCMAGFFARMSYAMARTPLLPLFALSLGADPKAIGFVVGASTITGIFFKLPSGTLSDIYGRYKMLLISIFIFAIVPFTYYFITSYWHLVYVRFFHGLATSIYGPVAMAAIADIAGNRKGERLSLFSSVTIIGSLVGAPLGGFILNYLSIEGSNTVRHFHMAYIACGIIGLVSLGLILKLWTSTQGKHIQVKHTMRDVWQRFFKGVREIINDYRIIITSATEGVQNLSVGALEAFLPVYAVVVAKLDPFRAGILWGVQVFATILSKPVMGKISDRYGRKPIIFSGMWICAIPFACIPLTQNFSLLLAFAMIFGIGEAFVTSSSAAMVTEFCKEQHYGAAMGVFGSIFDIGHASGPILAGFLLANLNYHYTFSIIALLLIVSSILFLFTVKERKSTLFEGGMT